jgi:hypothetical protein
VIFLKCFLQRMQFIPDRKPFDRLDMSAIGLHRQHQAPSDWFVIDKYSAGSAHTYFATRFCTRQPE